MYIYIYVSAIEIYDKYITWIGKKLRNMTWTQERVVARIISIRQLN